MSRILVYGIAPLPFENTQKNYGPGIRSWQFAAALAAAGHEVRLVAVMLDDAYLAPPVAQETVDGVQIDRVAKRQFVDPGYYRSIVSTFAPHGVVGATIYGSYALTIAHPEVPLWADQFGNVMAEAQAKSALDGHDAVVPYFWHVVEPVLCRADRLSVVSERQRWAAIGELGAVGRLTFRTVGYDFTSVAPCALQPASARASAPPARRRTSPIEPMRALWSGSYNTWSDVRTLIAGLEMAMERNGRIRFVSTGGEVPGHDESTYRELVERVGRSRFAERFDLRGWVLADDLPAIVADCDLGVLTERPIYEGMLGSKNRVVQWMSAGLPVAYNRIGDLGDLLAQQNLGLTFPVGDAGGLADCLCWAAEHPLELAAMADRAAGYAQQNLTFAATTRELTEWAAKPVFAPDEGYKPASRFRDTVAF